MKLTKRQLKKIIKEELQHVLKEQVLEDVNPFVAGGGMQHHAAERFAGMANMARAGNVLALRDLKAAANVNPDAQMMYDSVMADLVSRGLGHQQLAVPQGFGLPGNLGQTYSPEELEYVNPAGDPGYNPGATPPGGQYEHETQTDWWDPELWRAGWPELTTQVDEPLDPRPRIEGSPELKF